MASISFYKENPLKRYHIGTRDGWDRQMLVSINEKSDKCIDATKLWVGDNIYLQSFFDIFPSIKRFHFNFESFLNSFPFICYKSEHVSVKFTQGDECKNLGGIHFGNLSSVSIVLSQPVCADMLDDVLDFVSECKSLKLVLYQGLTPEQANKLMSLKSAQHIELQIPKEIIEWILPDDRMNFGYLFEDFFSDKIWSKRFDYITKKGIKFSSLMFDRK
jgi:hypothetical protein